MLFDKHRSMDADVESFSGETLSSPGELRWASASKSLHLALALARARHGLSPEKNKAMQPARQTHDPPPASLPLRARIASVAPILPPRTDGTPA